MTETRKLTTILAADVAGYSRLAAVDEERTLARLRALRSDLVDPAISIHHGRVVKRTGDGVLVEFRSPVEAVRCAIEVQDGMAERNAGLPPERRIEFRVGIHLGDVVEEADGDLMGDAVNVAARIEGIAERGGICLSRAAYELVDGKITDRFTDLGDKALKNIPKPVRVFALARSGVTNAETVGGSAPPRLSIVVLPFANIGGDQEQEYFVDGVTESLTTDLSRISGSFVIARNTAFTFKGKPIDAKQIGRELNVRYVLEGSVQRGGNRLRVNVQLIDAESGNHLWAERFDKPVADLFDMQDEIVARMARTLNVELVAAEARRAQRVPHPDSLDLAFRGWATLNHGANPATIKAALEFFDRALGLDPDNIEALAGKARAHQLAGTGMVLEDRDRSIVASKDAVMQVLQRAPNHALAHAILGAIYAHTDQQERAMSELRSALALDRNEVLAHVVIGMSETFRGHPERTEAHITDALRLSPLEPLRTNWFLIAGGAKLALGLDSEAVTWLNRAIDANRNYALPQFFLAAAHALLGEQNAAEEAAKAGLALDPKFTIRNFRRHVPSTLPAYLAARERIHGGMRKAGVPEGEPDKPAAPRLSIVVLPFTNIGGDPEQEYFVDGVTESLTTDLSRISGSFVIARNTAFTYKGKPVDVKQIGRDLNVRYVLEGSAQRGGNRLRVNVQLIDAESGNHLWAERFDKPVADLFDMQDEIVSRLANQLNAQLIVAEARHAERSLQPDALDLYFQGMAWANKGTKAEYKAQARSYFERALALDPNNVDALVAMARVDATVAAGYVTNDRAERLAAAEATLTRALALATDHAEAHLWMGVVLIHTNRAAQGIAECEQALARDRNLATAHSFIGLAKYYIGQSEQTEFQIQEALRLSPRDLTTHASMMAAGLAKFQLGADEEAVAWFRRSIETNRNLGLVHFYLAAALAQLGRLDEARTEARAGLALDSTFTVRRLQTAAPSDNPVFLSRRERIYVGLRMAGVPEGEPEKSTAPRLSIVVLPFANIGGDPEQEYFVDGVTESLTTDLSRISGSFVIARNTAFTFKGKPVDVKQIGRDLNVRYVLEGSVQRGGNRLRVNVQLIDAETGSHFWAERFDKPVADLFDMQDEIVARLAGATNAQLFALEARRAGQAPHPNSMDMYFQGLARWNGGRTPEHMRQARTFFERALMLDPNNIDALVGTGLVDASTGGSILTDDRYAAFADAESSLTKALSVVPNHALAHLWLGIVEIFTNRAVQGMAECERALAFDRNLATAHAAIGMAKYILGRAEESEADVKEALRFSPHDALAYVWMTIAGHAKLHLGAYQEAVGWLHRAVETNRNYALAHFYLAAALAHLGSLSEARTEVAAALSLDPKFTITRYRFSVSSDNPVYLAQRERIYDGMRKAGVPEG